MNKILLLLLSFSLFFISKVDAQQRSAPPSEYESLLQRADQPRAYTNHIVIPKTDGSATFGVTFRLDYDFIPFLRVRRGMNPDPEDAEYFAPVRMGLEIFEGHVNESRRADRQRQTRSVFRENYRDTVFVRTFEETKSRFDHAQGFLSTTLQPGKYNYNLQLARGESVREQSSQRRNVSIAELDTLKSAGIVLLSNIERSDDNATATLLNFGSNVLYGQNYDLLFILPDDDSEEYQLSVYRLRSGDSTRKAESSPTYEATLNRDDTFKGRNARLEKSGDDINLRIDRSDSGIRFGSLSVPNNEFENARYKLELKNGEGELISERIVNSQWLDMPVSLLNIDVAINMLRFIVDDDKLRQLRSGSSSEKERKFREFWAERDPTPDTEFNELMAEYYSRIDRAYERFTTPQNPGFETDQGRSFIVYGEPRNITREFPTNAPTKEIWEYRNRTLVFEATTGFGDFRLVEER